MPVANQHGCAPAQEQYIAQQQFQNYITSVPEVNDTMLDEGDARIQRRFFYCLKSVRALAIAPETRNPT